VSDDLAVTVECYAGYRGEQTPRVVWLGGRSIEATTILDQWLGPDHRYFKFADPAGDTYIIRHDVMRDQWELTTFERGGRDESDGLPDEAPAD
jgi:hypothetical protein